MKKDLTIEEIFKNFDSADLKYGCPSLDINIVDFERVLTEAGFCRCYGEAGEPLITKIDDIEIMCKTANLYYGHISLKGMMTGSTYCGEDLTNTIYAVTFTKNKQSKNFAMVSVSLADDSGDEIKSSLTKIDESMKGLGLRTTIKTIPEIAQKAMEKVSSKPGDKDDK